MPSAKMAQAVNTGESGTLLRCLWLGLRAPWSDCDNSLVLWAAK